MATITQAKLPAPHRRAQWYLTRSGESYVNRLYAKFNLEYFDGRLPIYQVKFTSVIRYGVGHQAAGLTHRRTRTIWIDAFEVDQLGLMETLIHEMIHVSGPRWHGDRFADEAVRLTAVGAPVMDGDTITRSACRALGKFHRGERVEG